MKRGKGQNRADPAELRMRSELDVLRREVKKLKRQLLEAQAKPGGAPAAATDEPKATLPTDMPPLALVPQLVRTPFYDGHSEQAEVAELDARAEDDEADEAPVADDDEAADIDAEPIPPAVLSIAPPALARGWFDERSELAQRVTELETAKQRLSRLYFQQLEDNKKRAQKLHVVLENLRLISGQLELDGLLERLAATIQGSLGFQAVLVRLREPDEHVLRARAFAGIDADARVRLDAESPDADTVLSWLRDEFRISGSYFIGHASGFNRALPRGHSRGLGARPDWEWHEDDVLIVPLFDRSGDLVAYVSVDDPADRLVPSREVIEMLEIYAHHALVAIDNARLVRELETRSRTLEESQRQHDELHQLKSNFLSAVSHELRTPLTSIRAFVDTLLGAGYGEISYPQMRHFLSIINEDAQRLSRLIESLLDLNRFDSGLSRLSRQRVSLSEIAEETIRLLEPVAQVGRVGLKLDARCADTRVDASRDQLRQLALHLGSNAVKFTPAGGSVTFVLTGDSREVGLEVVDTGVGIPAESLDRIFERFYQVDSSLVRRYGGAGIGLAICKSIVDWHAGTIHADSTPGNGTRIAVTLPRRTRPRVIVQPAPAPEAAAADILHLAIEMVSEVMGARVVSLLCPDPDGWLSIRAAMGVDEDIVRRERVEPGRGVAGWVALHRRPICASNADDDPEVPRSGRTWYRTNTFLSVPIERDGELLGVLNATDPVAQDRFDAEDCHLFVQLAQRIAAAWSQALDAEEQQAGVADTAHTLRQLLRHFERGRRSAPDRIHLARALAREADLTDKEIAEISFAASVHDIGMDSLGEQIVEGAGTLSAAERRQVELHPEAGADMLAPLEAHSGVRELVLTHHEWWDGSGYPRGLRGEEIPLGGRILAIVDAYESMTVGRAHRTAVSRDEALHEIAQLSGKQFDPQLVARLPEALAELDRSAVDAPTAPADNHADRGR